MEATAPVVVRTARLANFWCHGQGADGTKHDKVYRLEIQEFQGVFSVTGLFGRRGTPLKLFVIADGVPWGSAVLRYEKKEKDLTSKGYNRVIQDVSTTPALTVL